MRKAICLVWFIFVVFELMDKILGRQLRACFVVFNLLHCVPFHCVALCCIYVAFVFCRYDYK